jgi:cell fate (sporulation/competence/biofilm development) regulator YlbF (YheA/YmcA/DUF963 family)
MVMNNRSDHYSGAGKAGMDSRYFYKGDNRMLAQKDRGGMPDVEHVLQMTKELNESICQTEDYLRYQDSLNRLRERREVYEKLNEYRRKNLKLNDLEEGYEEAVDALYNEYIDILNIPEVMDFMSWETRVNRMLRRVFNCIAEGVYIDISYMD